MIRLTFRKIISRLEVAMERIEFLEKKIKQQDDERNEDNQRFMEIIGKSKEMFKVLYDKDGVSNNASAFLESTVNSVLNESFT